MAALIGHDYLPHQVLASELSFPPTDHTPTLERTVHALSTTLWKRLLAEASVRRRAPTRLCVTWREGYASDGGTTRGVLHSRGLTWPTRLGTILRASAVSSATSGAVSGTDAASLLATSAIKLLHAHMPTMPLLTRLIVAADFGQGKDKAHGARDGARDGAPASPLRDFLQRKTSAAEPRPASELGVAGAVLGTDAASELGAVAAATSAAVAAAADEDVDADAHAAAPTAAHDDNDDGGALGQRLPRIWIVDEYDEYDEYDEAEAEEEDYCYFYSHVESEGSSEGLTVGHVTDELVPKREGDDVTSEMQSGHVTDELVPMREGDDVTSEGRASGTADVVQHGAIEAVQHSAIEAPRGMRAAGASSSTCCPICGHDLGSLDNAQLNRHVDDCLNLGHSHVLGSPDRHSSIGSQPGASSGKRRRAGMSPASGVSRSAEEQSEKRGASLNTWIVRSSQPCDMASKTSRLD